MARFHAKRIDPFADALLLTLPRFSDDRGWFLETHRQDEMDRLGIRHGWAQDNHSYSRRRGTLRGLHYQAQPVAQAKLVRCTRGRVFDVLVDAREASPTFGAWRGVELAADSPDSVYVPEGFLHGFQTLTDDAEVAYKVSRLFSPEHDGAIRWDDPDLGVAWPVKDPIVSPKDAAAPRLRDRRPLFTVAEARP